MTEKHNLTSVMRVYNRMVVALKRLHLEDMSRQLNTSPYAIELCVIHVFMSNNK